MDPNNVNSEISTQQPPQPIQPEIPSPSPAPSPKKGNKIGLWIAFVLLIIISLGAIGGVYIWQNKLVQDEQKKVVDTQAELATSVAKYKQLRASVGLPTNKDVGHSDCSKKDLSNTIHAALTPEPIGGYQAYLQTCLGDGPEAPSLQGMQRTSVTSVVVFKANSDGTKSFKFGAGTGEPLCFSSKILPASTANALSEATKLPICKTF